MHIERQFYESLLGKLNVMFTTVLIHFSDFFDFFIFLKGIISTKRVEQYRHPYIIRKIILSSIIWNQKFDQITHPLATRANARHPPKIPQKCPKKGQGGKISGSRPDFRDQSGIFEPIPYTFFSRWVAKWAFFWLIRSFSGDFLKF